jgi:MoxR-like ATPase
MANQKLVNKIQEAREKLEGFFYERTEEILSLILGLLIKENSMLLGYPGSGKSLLVRAISKLVDWTGSDGSKPFYQNNMSKYKTPDQVFGPRTVRHNADGTKEIVQLIENFLPNCRVAFIDETPRGGTILDEVLTAVNERLFFDIHGNPVQIPLETTVGAANSEFSGTQFEALRDRFLLWHVPNRIPGGSTRVSYLCGSKTLPTLPVLSEKELAEIRQEISMVDGGPDQFSQATAEKFDEMMTESETGELKIFLSERRMRQIIKLVKAYAWLQGRDHTLPEDLEVGVPAWWQRAEQIPEVKKFVMKHTNSEKAEIVAMRDEAVILFGNWQEQKDQMSVTEVADQLLAWIQKISSKKVAKKNEKELAITLKTIQAFQAVVEPVARIMRQRQKN